MIYAFVAICLFGGALAEVPTGNCRNVSPLKDLDMTAFYGKWYEVTATDRNRVLPCFSARFGNNNGDDYVEFEFLNQTLWEKFYDPEMKNNITDVSFDSIKKPLVFPSPDGENLTLSEVLLATDYTSYAIFYFCIEEKPSAVVFARKFFPEDKVLREAEQIISDKGISGFKFIFEKPICNELRLAWVKKN